MENLEEFGIPEEAIEKLNDPDFLKKHIEEGETFQDLLEYSDDTMEKFYATAYKLFENESYNAASDAFIFLTTLNPYIHNYWIGLAMCEQKLEEYEAALIAYGMAVLIWEENPVSHYHLATCYKKVGDDGNAKLSLEKALHYCGDEEEYEELKKYVLIYQRRLNQ